MRCISNTIFGSNHHSLRLIYIAYIRPLIEYGCIIFYPLISQTHKTSLETLQNTNARIITGLYYGTDLKSLLFESNLETIQTRINNKILFLCEKYYRFNNNYSIVNINYDEIIII